MHINRNMTANFIDLADLIPVQFNVREDWGKYHEIAYYYCGIPITSIFIFLN